MGWHCQTPTGMQGRSATCLRIGTCLDHPAEVNAGTTAIHATNYLTQSRETALPGWSRRRCCLQPRRPSTGGCAEQRRMQADGEPLW